MTIQSSHDVFAGDIQPLGRRTGKLAGPAARRGETALLHVSALLLAWLTVLAWLPYTDTLPRYFFLNQDLPVVAVMIGLFLAFARWSPSSIPAFPLSLSARSLAVLVFAAAALGGVHHQ